MASATKAYKARKHLKDHKAGRKRKNKLDNHGTTPSKAQVFGDDGEKKAS